MNYSRFVTAIFSSLLLSGSALGHAETIVTCQDVVKTCFATSSDERDSCIQKAATNPACESSKLAALVEKRAQFVRLQPLSEDQGPAFLGPQIINRRCVDNFDTAWSAALVKGPLTNESIARFSTELDGCASSGSTTLPRP